MAPIPRTATGSCVSGTWTSSVERVHPYHTDSLNWPARQCATLGREFGTPAAPGRRGSRAAPVVAVDGPVRCRAAGELVPRLTDESRDAQHESSRTWLLDVSPRAACAAGLGGRRGRDGPRSHATGVTSSQCGAGPRWRRTRG